MRLLIAGMMLCAVAAAAEARPQKPDVAYSFSGDRYQFADMGFNVKPSLQRPAKRKGKAKERRKPRPVVDSRTVARRHPVPVPRGAVASEAAPRIATPARVIGERPAGCPPRAWCGCWLAHHLGLRDRSLWLARNWAQLGRPSGPQPGAIVVFARGRGGHVGKVTAVAPGRIKVLSGNDGRMVRERWRDARRGVIAYRLL